MRNLKYSLLGLVLAFSPKLVLAQGNCAGQAQPVVVSRAALSCSIPRAVCTCAANGAGCHNEWACPIGAGAVDPDSDLIKKEQQLRQSTPRKPSDTSQTWNLGNGRMWMSLANDQQRLLYLSGIQEGVRRSATESGFQNVYLSRFGDQQASVTAQALTRFYAEAENLPIPVLDALTIVTMRANGARQEDIDQHLSILRAVASQAPEQQR